MARALLLASASRARARMLRDAGLVFDTAPAAVDEAGVRESMQAEGASAADAAAALAALKAVRISTRRPEELVVGADQILSCEGRWYGKPEDRAGARAQLAALRARTHRLDTAACVALGGSVIWRGADSARLVMRPFSDGLLDRYVAECGEDDLGSAGAYRIEGPGVQLFAEIDGDHFAILGLPLLPLLEFLRGHGAVGR